MKTIIAGGRDYYFDNIDLEELNRLKDEIPITEIVSGKCPTGVDKCGEDWAEAHNIPIKPFKANWNKYGRAAGPIRNEEMARYADVLIAFPGGNGTRNMLELAMEYKLITYQKIFELGEIIK